MENNIRFDLTICKETNTLQREIRKFLQEKGYIRKLERHNCFMGGMRINIITEWFVKGNMIFEIERDLENKVVSAVLHYRTKDGKKEHHNIRLGDIKSLA